ASPVPRRSAAVRGRRRGGRRARHAARLRDREPPRPGLWAELSRRGCEAVEVNAQIRELVIAYVATATPFLGALLMLRAQGRAYFRWPVYSVMVMVLGVVLWNLIHRRLPAEWNVTHAAALYYGAL